MILGWEGRCKDVTVASTVNINETALDTTHLLPICDVFQSEQDFQLKNRTGLDLIQWELIGLYKVSVTYDILHKISDANEKYICIYLFI